MYSFTTKSAMLTALDNLCYPDPSLNQDANLTDALLVANNVVLTSDNGQRSLTQALIIAVTSVTPSTTAATVARPMKRTRPITIATIGVTPAVDTSVLEPVASATGFNFYSPIFDNLVSLIPSMTPQECRPVPTVPGNVNSTCK